MSGSSELERYAVQARVEQLGAAGQRRLRGGRAAIVGVGALGSSIAHQLVRGGVGFVRLIDGDRAELGNLHRQILYTEADVAAGQLKAAIAADHLRQANSEVTIEAVTERLTAQNGRALIDDVDVIVDGTDNLATRYVINDLCVASGVPWVYGGIAGVFGMVMPILVGRGPCLRCVFSEGPPAAEEPTSVTTGVFGPTPAIIGAFEAAQAMRILVGDLEPPIQLLSINVWTGETDRLTVKKAEDCPTCGGFR